MMTQPRHPASFHNKNTPSSNPQTYYSSNPDSYLTPYKQIFNIVSSQHTQQPNSVPFSMKSSIIADEGQGIRNINMKKYQWQNNHKIDTIDQETNEVVQKKDREIYFLKIELSNYQKRLKEKQDESASRQHQILRLKQQISTILDKQNKQNILNRQYKTATNNLPYSNYQKQYLDLQQENQKLKQSIQTLIKQRSTLKSHNKKNISSANSTHTAFLKKQVQELRSMIAQMQTNINCPSCFTLKRQNQQLVQAYQGLQKQYSTLAQNKTKEQTNLLQNITSKIQENQNIVRQNHRLKQQKGCVTLLKLGRERLKQSVAKRCRTLTDQF